MSTHDIIQQRLESLQPETIELHDESHEHAGHAGAKGAGGHYRLFIVSKLFAGKTTLARHRMVYAAVGDLMNGSIHALAITAQTPEELNRMFSH
ncbi:MAG: BolA family transcriptional regulator [Betaproteobacteria bacterium]|nr:BolA family transcriptional regulator [Betaproteobacteria bacterium]